MDRWRATGELRTRTIFDARALNAQMLTQAEQALPVWANLSHPYVERIHELVENKEHLKSVGFMEHVRGGACAELLRRHGSLRKALVVHRSRRLDVDLEHAHERGLLHRNLRLSNVLMTVSWLRGQWRRNFSVALSVILRE